MGVGTLGYSQGRSCVADTQSDEMLETSVQAARTLPVSGRDADMVLSFDATRIRGWAI